MLALFGDFSVYDSWKRSRKKLWRSTFTTCHMTFKKWLGGSVHIFSMACCKSAHYDSKGCCSNNTLFLMLVFGDVLFLILRKMIKKQNCEDQHLPHVTWHFKRWVGGSLHIFSRGAVKVPTMIQKGAVQTTCCFWCWFLVMGFLFVILGKDQQTKYEDQHLPHVTWHVKDGWEDLFTFSMGCCKSVHCDSKGCCSNNIVFLMFLLHYSKVISYNVLSKFSDVSSRSVQKKHLS